MKPVVVIADTKGMVHYKAEEFAQLLEKAYRAGWDDGYEAHKQEAKRLDSYYQTPPTELSIDGIKYIPC